MVWFSDTLSGYNSLKVAESAPTFSYWRLTRQVFECFRVFGCLVFGSPQIRTVFIGTLTKILSNFLQNNLILCTSSQGKEKVVISNKDEKKKIRFLTGAQVDSVTNAKSKKENNHFLNLKWNVS